MKLDQQTALSDTLKEEELHPDTIFLRKHRKGWIAYGNSAVMFQRYFEPVWLRMATVGGEKVPYTEWFGAINVRRVSPVQELQFCCENPNLMLIRCPGVAASESKMG